MSAWGHDTFDNDAAGDWAYRLEECADLTLVAETLALVLDAPGGYLDADAACEALAACEVVARLRGRHGKRDTYTEVVDAWVAAHPGQPPPEVVARALAAIERVLGPGSELAELWQDGADTDAWRAAVADLRARVAE
jgi:hypothetical protein